MTNPYLPALRRLFNTLNALYGMLHVQTSQLQAISTKASAYLAAQSGSPAGLPSLLTSTSLFIVDLQDSEWNTSASGGFAAFDHDFVNVIQETADHYAAFVAAQSFERFESFLWDSVAEAFKVDPTLVVKETWDKFAAKEGIPPGAVATEGQLRAYAKYHCRGAKTDPRSLLRAWLPGLSILEAQNLRSIQLAEWFDVFAVARHAITHSDAVIPAAAVASWTPEHHNVCRRHFPTTPDTETNGHRLNLDEKLTRNALLILSDYAFAIYKQLSVRQSFAWDFRQGSV